MEKQQQQQQQQQQEISISTYRQMFNILYLQYLNNSKSNASTDKFTMSRFERVASDIFGVFKVHDFRRTENYKELYKMDKFEIMQYDALLWDLHSLFDQLIARFKEMNSRDYVFEVPDVHKPLIAMRTLFYLINGKEL